MSSIELEPRTRKFLKINQEKVREALEKEIYLKMLRKKGNDDNMADEVLVPNILLGSGEPESEQNSQFFVTR